MTRIDMPGAHGDFQPERFIALAEQLLKAMQESGTSVSPQNKVATAWGQMKHGKQGYMVYSEVLHWY